MKSFLAIFTCAENSKNHELWKKLTPEEQQERLNKGMAATGEWYSKYNSKILFNGGPLSDKTTLVDLKGLQEIPSKMRNFVVIEASSAEEAAKMFTNHPHFAIFPGDGVEILERQDFPRG